jgi:sialate O-acetylesterase
MLRSTSKPCKNDKGLSEKWHEKSFQPSGWKKMTLPREWSETELRESDGIVWFRKEVDLPLVSRCIRRFWD